MVEGVITCFRLRGFCVGLGRTEETHRQHLYLLPTNYVVPPPPPDMVEAVSRCDPAEPKRGFSVALFRHCIYGGKKYRLSVAEVVLGLLEDTFLGVGISCGRAGRGRRKSMTDLVEVFPSACTTYSPPCIIERPDVF